MAVAVPIPSARYRDKPTLRQRAGSLALTVAIVALLLLLLIRLGVVPSLPDRGGGTTMFAVQPTTESKEKNDSAPRQQDKARPASKAPTSHPKPTTQPPTATTLPPVPQWPGIMMRLGRDQFAKSDISKLPSHSEDSADASESSGGAGGAGSSKVAAGGGPHGETLYMAEWYREPTNAELSTYLGARAGYGTVACRTIERYHVDDCQILGETPGSGLSYAVQRAAWQFLVRPPRVNGKPQIGAWVSIRITNIIRRTERREGPLGRGTDTASRDEGPPPGDDEPPAAQGWSLPKGNGTTPQGQVYGPH